MKIFKLFTAALLFSSLTAYAAEDPATTLISTDLKQEPFIDAQVIINLPVNTSVTVLKRQAGWVQVKSSGGAQGWLKMTSIKLGSGGASGKGDNGIMSLFNVARSGRSGNNGVVVTTGVRGLTPEELNNASPNAAEVKKMDNFPKGKKEADTFASAGKLQSQQVDYLAASQPTSTPTQTSKPFVNGGHK
ncbi:SH3 domain-containing protein [Methyloradius palustris]|uniref:SH3b domain-containing protein n=1 Tax=Methyloradius palustris TaxID=2778876 RepID=A0A8D5G620_9PROT|nr:SH3 domain-containing protein [Methyloradius palustris]BCM23961.1 hypothetical protein ZMTM_02200 [Methyloradius palustris]